MNSIINPEVKCDNMIIVDADHADRVAFDLIVNFERMLERPIPNADLPRWLDCMALDGGITAGDDVTQVALVHGKDKARLEYFTPGGLHDELDGQAFRDHLGEFIVNAFSEESIISREDLLLDILQLALNSGNVKRIVVVPDEESIPRVRQALRHVSDDKRVTLLTMQPVGGGDFRSDLLGYSLMNALGIRGEELKP
ncbi:MAG: hypothetical protein J5529_03180 [Prevotella sp.]|nr:hypothetical protein [Prevotella sp.]